MLALVAAALSFSSAPAECACNPTTTSLDHSQNENTKVATAGGCVKEHFQEGAAEVVWCDTDVANGKWGVCGEIDGGLYEALEAGYGPGASPPGGFTGKNVCPGKAAAPVVEVRSSLSPHGQTRVLLATHMRLPFRAGDHRVCQRHVLQLLRGGA